MEPRKSRALIITFIIVLVLLIVGYFLIVKGGIIKSDSAVGKKFAPILGTPKQKDVIVDTNNGTDVTNPPAETPTEPTNTGPNLPTNPGSGGGKPNIPKYVPPNLSLPKPDYTNFTPKQFDTKTQCADGKDNDNDTSIDAGDADCHYDKNAKNAASYVASYNLESGSKNTEPNIVTPDPKAKKNISCDVEEIPLVFTAAEQAELDSLTREFYRLAPQLKTEEDIVSEVLSKQGYEDLISNAKNLTQQCRDQTGTPAYLRNEIDQTKGTTEKILSLGLFLDAGVSFGRDQSCFTNPELCHVEYEQFYNIPDVLVSTLDKGRTERLPNPYYDASKEIYPWKPTESYYRYYMTDPRVSNKSRGYTGNNILQELPQWEKARKVW